MVALNEHVFRLTNSRLILSNQHSIFFGQFSKGIFQAIFECWFFLCFSCQKKTSIRTKGKSLYMQWASCKISIIYREIVSQTLDYISICLNAQHFAICFFRFWFQLCFCFLKCVFFVCTFVCSKNKEKYDKTASEQM